MSVSQLAEIFSGRNATAVANAAQIGTLVYVSGRLFGKLTNPVANKISKASRRRSIALIQMDLVFGRLVRNDSRYIAKILMESLSWFAILFLQTILIITTVGFDLRAGYPSVTPIWNTALSYLLVALASATVARGVWRSCSRVYKALKWFADPGDQRRVLLATVIKLRRPS